MPTYDSKTSYSMPINVDKPNYYPGSNVYPSAHNTGNPNNSRTDGGGGGKRKSNSATGYKMKKMSKREAPKY